MNLKFELFLLLTLSFLVIVPQCAAAEVKIAGWRSSEYGNDNPYGHNQTDPDYWISVAQKMSAKFPGSTPGGVLVVGEIEGSSGFATSTFMPFPKPAGTYPNVTFGITDAIEPLLTAYDSAGLKVYLQVESADADIPMLMDLVMNRYKQHPSVIGFGVDVEWYHQNQYPGGRPLTDEEVNTWATQVLTYNPNYNLMVKHWDATSLSNARPANVLFLTDSEQMGSLSTAISNYTAWIDHFSPSQVSFQIGYPSDMVWWSKLSNPASSIISPVISARPNANIAGVYWVDFSVLKAFPVGESIVNGTVFDDTNNNGIKDIGEPGLAGVQVFVVDYPTSNQVTVTTDTNGVYNATGLLPNAVLVQVTPIPIDTMPSTGFTTYSIPTLNQNATTTVNFPLVPITPANRATINGTVFEDTNDNGVQDVGEIGLAGVQVFVVDFLTLTQTTVLTDTNGTYTATGILPDVVLVQASPILENHIPSMGLFTYDSLTLSQGKTTTVNFALKPVVPAEKGTILIDVFNDTNADGIKDIGEVGVQNAVVFTYELLTAKPDVQVTGSTGITTHSGLIPDVVLAQINAAVLPPGFSRITTANAGYEFIQVTPGSTTTVKIGLH